MYANIVRYLLLAFSIVLMFAGFAGVFLAYQGSVTYDVIEMSLNRHVSQFLIEQSTSEIIQRELTFQNRLIWVQTLLLIGAGVSLSLRAIKKGTH